MDAPREGSAESSHLFPSLERFHAFSDAVFAIAITLLVLQLPVPPADVALWSALVENRHGFLAYLVSFAFIGGIWLTHAGMTSVMRRGDSVAYGVNLLVLLFVGVLPFSTNVMVTHLRSPDVGLAVVLYGLNLLLASLTLSLLMTYLAAEPALLVGPIADDRLTQSNRLRWFTVGFNVFAIAVALVAPLVAVGLYVVTTGWLLMLPLLELGHRARTRGQGHRTRRLRSPSDATGRAVADPPEGRAGMEETHRAGPTSPGEGRTER